MRLAFGYVVFFCWSLCATTNICLGEQLGKTLYEMKCGGCHSLDENRVGPKHRNVFGRRAGTVEAYDYSTSLRNAKLVWNQTNLNAWLADPNKLIPGQKMWISVSDETERKLIIEYLRAQTALHTKN